MQIILILAVLCLSSLAAADSPIKPRHFHTEVQETRYRALISELRCTVCQNEPLESSNAPLAGDLREQVYQQIMDGRADSEIRQYMRDRYGDFVLYNPPLGGRTLILWFSPFALLLIGLVSGAVMIHRRRRMLVEATQKN